MKAMGNWFQNVFSPALSKFSNMKYMLALRDGMIITVPFTIFGSIFEILANLPINGYSEWIKPYLAQLNSAVAITFGIISVIVAIGMSHEMAKLNKIDTLTGTAIGVAAFLLSMLDNKFTLDPSTLGSDGMFTAIVVSIVSSEIVAWFIHRHIVITLPDSVPPAVAGSFVALVPACASLGFFWIIRVFFNIKINAIITALFSPLVVGLNSFWGFELVLFITLILWTVGIHGNNVVGAVANPIYGYFIMSNIDRASKGLAPTHITADGFLDFGMNIGGTGAILALVICCLLFAKSKQYKQLARLGAVPSIFQISEPIMFGLPVVLNPVLCIPFVVIPMVLQGITYFMMKAGMLGMVIAQVPWTTPIFINGYLITGGDWRAPVWQLVELIIAILVYLPFFKIIDHQAYKLENSEQKDAISTTEAA